MDLKITNVSAMPVQLPLAKPISSALGRYTHVDCLVVRVHTADGPTGTGFSGGLGSEASRAMPAYIEAELTPRIIGQDALSPDALWHMMWAPKQSMF